MEEVLSGSCGAGIRWQLHDGTLTISGNGPIEDRPAGAAPWQDAADQIVRIDIREGITAVGSYAFCGCTSLKQVHIPATVRRLHMDCFRKCSALEEIAIPEGVELICTRAFSDCDSLACVYLPSSLKAIDMYAFRKADGLQTVHYAGRPGQWKRLMDHTSYRGNQMLLKAAVSFGQSAPKAELLYDDADRAYLPAVQYLLDQELPVPEGSLFAAAAPQWAIEVLYCRAGTPGCYDSAEKWAVDNGLTDVLPDSVTASWLMELLNRTVAYNGHTVESCSKWELLRELGDARLTAGQVASALAAFLQDAASTADRSRQIIDRTRQLLAQGGDGKLHFLTPRLTVRELYPRIDPKPGDCTLVIFPNGETMMIDAGLDVCQEQTVDFLRGIGLTHLDYFVLSHPHIDHVGGAMAVMMHLYSNGGELGTYYHSGYDLKQVEPAFAARAEEMGVRVCRNVHAGDQWHIGGVTIDILHPNKELEALGEPPVELANNLSLLMRFSYGASSYLCSGDFYTEQELVVAPKLGPALRADVMKANHHGLFTSNSRLWIETVSPKVVIADNDDIGCTEIIERIHSCGAAYYCDCHDGLMMLTMDDCANYQILCQWDSFLRQDYHGSFTGK